MILTLWLTGAAMATDVPLETEWSGRIHLSTPAPGAEPLAEPRVITDAKGWAAFLDAIPKDRIQKKQPAPPSDDPLLQRPTVDFDTHLVLVAVRDSMYVGPKITSVTRDEAGLTVTVDLPPLGDTVMAAAMVGVGTYHAVQVPRVDGPVTWK